MTRALAVSIGCVCLLCCSCASSRRMMSISPFGGPDRMPDAERVNVWPVVYHAGEATSVLWPVIDWDADGFAVRPLINKHGADWSVLFPVSAWNTEDREGWVGPVYHCEENSGLFPLVNFGEDWNHIGTGWWTEDGDHGVFPLYGWADGLHHVGPVWWDPDDPALGLFPAYHHDRSEGNGEYYLVLGLLAGWQRDEHDESAEWVVPVWFGRREDDESVAMLFPLWLSWRDGERRVILTPLGGRGWDASGETRLLNVVGPVYHYHGDDEHAFHAVCWPVFTVSDGDTWRLWPLVSHRGDKGREGLLHHLTAVRIEDTERRSALSVLGPFGFSHRRDKRDDGRPDWQTRFLLLFRFWHDELEGREIPLSTRPDWRSMTVRRGAHGAVVYRDRDTYRVWRDGALTAGEMKALQHWWQKRGQEGQPAAASRVPVAALLRRHGVDSGDGGDDDLLAGLEALAADHSRTVEGTRTGIPLIYKRSSLEDRSDWSFLFGAVRGDRDGDRSSVRILRYLYSRERDGDAVRRDLFPFIVWDSAPEEKRVSFLWRVFQYRRTDDGVGGHVLFVPWGTR